MSKIILSLLALLIFSTLYASDYNRANAAAKEALKDLDCDFDDCPKEAPQPKVIIQERVIIKEKPVYIEKVVEVEKPLIVEKVVYRDREAKQVVGELVPAPTSSDKRVYDAQFDIPVIGVVGSSIWKKPDMYQIENGRVISNKPEYNQYIQRQSQTPTWATMELKRGSRLFLKEFDDTIPFFKESMTQIAFHVELPQSVIADDSTIVSLAHKFLKKDAGAAEEYSYCTFNGFAPTDTNMQQAVKLHGKDYLDIKCSVVLWNWDQKKHKQEISTMIQTESFMFIPEYRVFPPVKKGSKKAILGSELKKFLFANEITE